MPTIRPAALLGWDRRGQRVLGSLQDRLVGRRIARVETEVRLGDRRGRATELELDDRTLCRVAGIAVEPAVTRETGVRATIEWRLIPPRGRSVILAPGAAPRYHRGEGSEDQRVLAGLLVGQVIAGLETGALTDEGYGVSRLGFESGDTALVFPAPLVGGGWAVAWAIPRRSQRMILPGYGFLGGA